MRTTLIALALVASGCGSSRVAGYGVSLASPPGWHVRVARGAWTATAPGVHVQLFEDTPDAQWSPPLAFAVYGRFPSRNFTVSGRYFDLFVQGSRAKAKPVVDSIRIQPGDFYPGGAPPARFRKARRWRISSIGTLPNGTGMLSVTIASTGRYVDSLADDAPRETLPRLGPDGIVIRVRLDAENRDPPSAHGTTFRFSSPAPCIVGDGPPLPRASCSGASRVLAREYTASVVVFYGRAQPTAAQRARADAELARLVLPKWVRWS
jgi:hypothetical protein